MRAALFTFFIAVFFTKSKAQDCDIATTGLSIVNASNTAPLSTGLVGQVFNFKFSIANFGTELSCTIPANSVVAIFDFPTLSGGIKPYIYNGPNSFPSGYFTWTYNSIDEVLVGTNTTAIPNGLGDATVLIPVIGNQTGPSGISVASSVLNIRQTGVTSDNTANNFSNAQLTISAISLRLNVLLEGATIGNGMGFETIMRDNLRNSPFTMVNYIPVADPYTNNPAYNTNFIRVGDGTNPDFQSITNPAAMFADRGTTSAVDWIFIELRDKLVPTTIVGTRSAIVQRDGSVVDIDGSSNIKFPSIPTDNYYVAVRHRNHLGVMTANPVPETNFSGAGVVDFSTMAPIDLWNNSMAYNGYEMKLLPGGVKRALWAGDADASRKIKYTAPGDDLFRIFNNALNHPGNISSDYNYDFGYGYIAGDVDMNSKVKYTAPGDDAFRVFVQLLGYGLNTGSDYNYDFFLEQLP